MKKFILMFLATTMFTHTTNIYVFARSEEWILSSTVANTYLGREEAVKMIENLNFSDIEGSVQEAVARAGALNIIKGENNNFYPSTPISRQDAITFILRAIGQEEQAQAQAIAVRDTLPADSPLQTEIALGFLSLANGLGLITAEEYANATVADPSTLDPTTNFVRTGDATREELAGWIYTALNTLDPNIFATEDSIQKIYTYGDWQDIDLTLIQPVEAITFNGIMDGVDGNFLPNGSLTRGEMALIMRNMDNLYFNSLGIEKKRGTVGFLSDEQFSRTESGDLERTFFVRTDSGLVDRLGFMIREDASPQIINTDAVVYKNGEITGLSSISDQDTIEYLVDSSGRLLYVEVLNSSPELKTVQGRFDSVNLEENTITIIDNRNKSYAYPLAQGIVFNEADQNYMFIDNRRQPLVSTGTMIGLSLRNNIVTGFNFVGEEVLSNEFRGIVLENNSNFGYLSVIDNNGNKITMEYRDNDLSVEKTPYYQSDDTIGYLNQMFPNFRYDPRTTVISEIEPGDIVFIRPNPDAPNTIKEISASTNYVSKYGKVKEISNNGDSSSLLLELENKQTQWFDIPNTVFVSKEGRPSNMSNIIIGDWTRLLVNQAILEPGYILEAVKELTIEGDSRFISTIVKGQLSTFNGIQKKMIIQNAQTLEKNGWSNYQNVNEYSIDNNDIEFYNDGNRVSIDFAERFLKRANGEVYIALENNFAGERVKKVSFRDSRDELLTPDLVLNTNNVGEFSIISNTGNISTDAGTIVRRYGRLVEGANITVDDYAVVSLNGNNRAAVVDIVDSPNTSAVMLVRGRIKSVDEGRSFTVQSMAILSGDNWVYTPIEREFKIDYNTLFLDENGYVDRNTFLDYTDATVINNVYDIIVDGSMATHVIDAPYSQRSIRGTIYEITDTEVRIKDVRYLDTTTNQVRWNIISNLNNTAIITMPLNSVVVKANRVETKSTLQVGDKIRAMSPSFPNELVPGVNITSHVVYVEN